MSRVTNIILAFEVLTDHSKTIEPLNKWLLDKYRNNLERVDQHAGGNKQMEVEVWMGAFNYFQVYELETQLGSWPEDLCITLMVQEQDDDHFRVLTIEDK